MNIENQDLLKRIEKLFDHVPAEPLRVEEHAKSPIFVESLEVFEHDLTMPPGEQTTHGNPADRWLDTPNTTFGGRCPRSFLQGSKHERDFLLRIIESVEDGAF